MPRTRNLEATFRNDEWEVEIAFSVSPYYPGDRDNPPEGGDCEDLEFVVISGPGSAEDFAALYENDKHLARLVDECCEEAAQEHEEPDYEPEWEREERDWGLDVDIGPHGDK